VKLANIEDPDYVGMAYSGGDYYLALQKVYVFFVTSERRVQKLDSDDPIQF
jgi:hypothetical protein